MKTLNVIEQIRFGDIPCPVLAPVYTLTLEHTEEAFTGGIVAAVTHGAHGADQGVQLQEALVIAAAKLPRSECRITGPLS